MSGPYTLVSFPFGNGQWDELYWTMKPLTEPTDCYFYAVQFLLADTNYVGGYVGLQTYLGGLGGKGAIFSVWEAINAQHGTVKYGGSIAGPFGGEGVGYQTLIQYPWKANKTYEMSAKFIEPGIIEAKVGKDIIGIIEVPSSFGHFYPLLTCWTERYGGDDPAQHAAVQFTDFKMKTGRKTVKADKFDMWVAGEGTGWPATVKRIKNGVEQTMGAK